MILKLNILLKRMIQDLLGFNLGDFLSFSKRCRFHKKTLQNDAAADDDEEKRYGELQEIPKELLEIIFSGVNLSDRFRLKAVCKSWKDILDDNSFVTTPWMLLPPPRYYDSTLSFFDMVEGKIHKFRNFPKELKGSSYCGSSKGWMLLGKGRIRNPSFYLFNPLSMSFLELPSVLTIPKAMLGIQFGSIDDPHRFLDFARRLRLTSTNAFNSTVAVIFGYQKEVLAVCKAGIDDCWIIIERKPENTRDYFMDIMFSKDGRTLNVLKDKEGGGDIITVTQHMVGCESIAVKHISSSSVFQMPMPSIFQDRLFRIVTNMYFRQHLVESIHGELLIVTFLVNCLTRVPRCNHSQDGMESQRVGEIRVHLVHENNNGEDAESEQQVNVIGMTSTEIKSLGEQVLFVAEAGSFSYKAPANVEGIQNNHIYFIADDMVNPDADYDPRTFRKCGVYSLDQRKFIQFNRWCSRFPHHFKPCWFTPTL